MSKFQKTPVSNFIAINQVKEQGTNALSRHRNLLFWFWSQKGSKRTGNKVLIKSWKLAVLVFEAINKARRQQINVLSRHRNFSFWISWFAYIKKIYFLIILFRSWIEENRTSCLHMFFKIFILKNVTNFTGRHVLELLLYKAADLKA